MMRVQWLPQRKSRAMNLVSLLDMAARILDKLRQAPFSVEELAVDLKRSHSRSGNWSTRCCARGRSSSSILIGVSSVKRRSLEFRECASRRRANNRFNEDWSRSHLPLTCTAILD